MGESTSDRIEEIFVDALGRAPHERADFLEAACGKDGTLRARVESLLDDHEQAGDFMKPPPESGPEHQGPGVGPDVEGSRVGDYTIRRVIASGGMGVVYEAQQEHPHRVVALKVMRPGIASASSVRRFEFEGQILARLRHPNIAQIYEAGTYGNGVGTVPYFAMEYIPGAKNLFEYASERGLNVRRRLELFVTVCNAVHHGHMNGVIHRDLKPANILVDSAGEPKIIDFGVARATDTDIALTTLQTNVGELIGTLLYMSPEQCEADTHDIDSRSDVYALGVLLYELLCGAPPYDLAGAALPDALHVIRDQLPARPSTINRALRGDLETITLKTLHKEREGRYQSAGDLASDIERYLNDQPILARPPSVRYHLTKFARRHKALLGGVFVLFTMLVVGTIVSSVGFIQANSQRLAAESEAARAAAIKQFLSDMIGATNFSEAGRRLSVVEVLDQAAGEIDSAFPDQPEIRAELRHLIGLSYATMSELPRSIEQLRLAFELHRDTLGETREETLASAHNLGDKLRQHWQWTEAEETLRWVVETRRRVLGENHSDTLISMSRLSKVVGLLGDLGEAETLARRAADGLNATLGEQDIHTLRAQGALSASLYRNGKVAESQAIQERTLEICRRALGEEHFLTLHFMRELGAFYFLQGKPEQAELMLRSSLETRRRLFGDDDVTSLYWMETFGWMLHRMGQTEKGEPLLRHSVQRLRHVAGERNLKTVDAMRRLGFLERDLGNLEAAEELLRQVVAIQRETLGEAHRFPAETLSDLGWVLRQRQKLDEAEALLHEALEKQREIIGNERRPTLVTMYRLGDVLAQRGEPDEAEALWQERLEIQRRVLGDDHRRTLASMNRLALHLKDRGPGELAEAEDLARESASLAHSALGAEDRLTFTIADTLAVVLHLRGKNEEAIVEFEAVAAAARKAVGDERWLTVMSPTHYVEALIELSGFADVIIEDPADPKQVLEALSDLYEAWGKPEKAAEYRELLREAEGADAP